MVAAVHGHIGSEPVRRNKGVGFLHGGKFHLSQDQRSQGAVKDIQFDGVGAQRDAVSGLPDQLPVDFLSEVAIGGLVQRKFLLPADHETAALVGKDVFVIPSADAQHRLAVQISLFNLAVGIVFQVFRETVDQIFSFDFHIRISFFMIRYLLS